jgi:alkylated DNA repair dioxygenase AlkB
MPSTVTLPMPDAEVRYTSGWLDTVDADALLQALREDVPWEVHRIRMFGREVASPRLSCWIGDAGATYTYSRTRFEPRPWTPALAALRDRLASEVGVRFNSVLANRYRDGHDAMGWHSDDEPELGPEPVIASISVGAPRTFAFRARADGQRVDLVLEHGSLLVMSGRTQHAWRHAIPRTRRPLGERVNLTFRAILPAGQGRASA